MEKRKQTMGGGGGQAGEGEREGSLPELPKENKWEMEEMRGGNVFMPCYLCQDVMVHQCASKRA